MESLWKDFEKLQEEFHETVEDYPMLEEDINRIFEKDIVEINELLDKNDEYYLKKAIRKLEDLIEYIEKTSDEIKDLYKEYETLTDIWNKLEINQEISEKVLDKINKQVTEANELIVAKNYQDVKKAIKLFQNAVKELKEYAK